MYFGVSSRTEGTEGEDILSVAQGSPGLPPPDAVSASPLICSWLSPLHLASTAEFEKEKPVHTLLKGTVPQNIFYLKSGQIGCIDL